MGMMMGGGGMGMGYGRGYGHHGYGHHHYHHDPFDTPFFRRADERHEERMDEMRERTDAWNDDSFGQLGSGGMLGGGCGGMMD
jgi:hypothetical protein